MNSIRTIYPLFVFLLGCNFSQQENLVKPRLKLSENKRYLVTEDEQPFFWMGGTVWGMAEWLSREEVVHYLDDRKEKGFNVVQVCLFWGKREEDPVRFTLNPPNAYGFKAFEEANGIPDPTQPKEIAGGSPLNPNDYWDHVEYIVQAMEKRNMVAAFLPVWGRRYVNGTHDNFSEKIFSDSTMHDYGKFLGEYFRAYSNIIWVLGGDVAADRGGDFLGHYRSMAEGIIAGITNKTVKWNEESDLWDYALMTYHPDGSPLKNSSQWFHKDPWLDFHMIETYLHRDMVYTAVRNDYSLDNPIKPTVMAEPGYEGFMSESTVDNSTDVQMRRQAYHSFFAGAAGFTYGAARDSLGNGPLFSPFKGWEKTLDMKGAQSMKFVKAFCLNHNWLHWTPAQDVILWNQGVGEFQKVAVIAEEKNEILVYFPDNTPVRIDLSKPFKDSKEITAVWYNPASGTYSDKSQILLSEGRIEITPPFSWYDAVLVLTSYGG